MKKFILFIFTLIIGFAVFCGLKIKADGIVITMEEGAQIRAEGTFQGLRFVGSINTLGGTSEHGFYLALGSWTQSEMETAIMAGSTTIGVDANERKLVPKTAPGPSLDFAVTIYGMDELSEYEALISAIAYAKAGDDYYFGDVQTRNIADVARAAYNDGREEELVVAVAEATRVKVTHSDSSVEYFADTNEVALADGDTLDLTRGTYSNALTISNSNITINGVYKEVKLTDEGDRDTTDPNYVAYAGETVFENQIQLMKGDSDISNIVLNGLKISITDTIVPVYFNSTGISNVTIKYNNITFASQNGISTATSGMTSWEISDVIIDNNFINADRKENTSGARSIYFNCPIKDFSITNNTIQDSYDVEATELKSSNHAIRLTRIVDNATILIKNNKLYQPYSDYLILIGEQMEEASYTSTITIENNKLAKNDTTINLGNIIGIFCLKSGSTVNIIHNYGGMFSPYFNVLAISATTKGKAFGTTTTENVTVNIKFNSFVVERADAWVTPPRSLDNPLAGDNVQARYGLLIAQTSVVTFYKNYYTGYNSFAFSSNTSKVAGQGYYSKGDGAKTMASNKASSSSEADTAYEAYLAG